MKSTRNAIAVTQGAITILAARHKTSEAMIHQLLEMGHRQTWMQLGEITDVAIVEAARV